MKIPPIGMLGSVVGEIIASHLDTSPSDSSTRAVTLIEQAQAALGSQCSVVADELRQRLKLPSQTDMDELREQVQRLESQLEALRREKGQRRRPRVAAAEAKTSHRTKTGSKSEGHASARGTGSGKRARAGTTRD